MLARAADQGFELFMVRRHVRADAFADAYVFPGGVVREDDFAEDGADLSAEQALARFAERGGDPPGSPELALALHRAAARELFEEAGVLLAVDASGSPAAVDDADAPTWAERRRAVQAGELTIRALLAERRLRPSYRALSYFSHWITPLGSPRRFDTRFFVAPMPAVQSAAECGIETFEGVWVGPHEALGRYASGTFPLVFPTRMHLQRLTGAARLGDLLELARTKPVQTVQPTRSRDEVGTAW
jgi:8-oxo-dGTP pyrophosphatase MutT (NUDIX family)